MSSTEMISMAEAAERLSVGPKTIRHLIAEGDLPARRSDFDRAFNLGDSRGPELLRTLGYERREDDWGNESWSWEPDHRDSVG